MPRADAGHMTRPVSLAGLPVVAAPVAVPGADMPLGVQLIGPPGGEAPCLAAAMRLEEGACGFPLSLGRRTVGAAAVQLFFRLFQGLDRPLPSCASSCCSASTRPCRR